MDDLCFVNTYEPVVKGREYGFVKVVLVDIMKQLLSYRNSREVGRPFDLGDNYHEWFVEICASTDDFDKAFLIVLRFMMNRCMSSDGTILMLQARDMEILCYMYQNMKRRFVTTSRATTG